MTKLYNNEYIFCVIRHFEIVRNFIVFIKKLIEEKQKKIEKRHLEFFRSFEI
jgi:hypothetical protein